MNKKYLLQALLCALLSCMFHFTANCEDDATLFFEIYCPEDKWLDCEDEIWNLSAHGHAYYLDYGRKKYLYHPQIKYHLNSCGTGYIERKWKTADPYGNWHSCSQYIHVGGSGFDGHHIKWPEAYMEIEGCNPSTHPSNLDHGYPHYYDSACSMVGYTYQDQKFNFGPACYKIVRRWQIIDWCNYKPNRYDPTGVWHFTQIIKVSNGDVPKNIELDDIVITTNDCEKAYVEIPKLILTGSDCHSVFDISHNSHYADQYYGSDASGYYPVGTTKFYYTVKYGCGYSKQFYQNIKVNSAAGPTPYCIYHLSTALMPVDNDGDGIAEEGMVDIWAKDFDNGSYHKCNNDELIVAFDPEGLTMSKSFTCDEVGLNELKIYFIDSNGSYNYCTVMLDVQNNAANIQNCQPASADDGVDEENEGDQSEETDDPSDPDVNGDNSDETDTDQDDSSHDSESDGVENTSERARISGVVQFKNEAALANVNVSIHPNETTAAINSTIDTTIIETLIDSFYNQSGTLIYLSLLDTVFTEIADTTWTAQAREGQSDENGIFTFDSLALNETYQLRLNMDVINYSSISNADAHAIYDHALGIKLIENPFKLIAADVNKNGLINIEDYILVVNVLLQIDDGFTDQDQYIFAMIDKKEEDLKILGKDEMIMIDVTEAQDYKTDFVAIMPGDVVDSDGAKFIENRPLITNANLQLNAFPNPFVDQMEINLWSDRVDQLSLNIISLDGKLALSREVELKIGMNSIKINGSEIERSGVYFIIVRVGDERLVQKIVRR